MNPVTYMTTIRGVKPLLTKVCCILLGLRDLQCVWKLVHVTFLSPIILRRLQIIFFFYFLKLGLTHPAAYMHIYTAEEMIQCLKQFCMEGWRWVLCWHSKQGNISGNDNSINPNQQWEQQTNKHNNYCIVASLRHDQNFNRVFQISITYLEPVCSLIYTACQAHVIYYIIIHGLSASTFFHIVSQNNTLFRNT